ncbi:MAG: multidrug effflux MFS transporter [Kordiimonadaceae bacterium]|nr:multidrug effflux MFS transporter [Kordiimonadaceae bacterium]
MPTADTRPFVKRPSFIFSLAAITALTATAVDVSLPAHPMIGRGFGTTAEAAGVIVSSYFIGYGGGQLLWGPLADRYGRMAPLYWGLLGFLITSILCATANDLETLSVYRAIQGIFGGSGPVISRAIARDQGGGKATANLLATIMMIFGAAPLLAPLVGSGILLVAGWRVIFWFLVLFAIALMLLSYFYIAPSRKSHSKSAAVRRPLSWGILRELFTTKDFLMAAGASTFLFFGYSAMLGVGAAMTERTYGLSPQGFGMLFAVAASAVIIGPAVTKRIIKTGDLRTPLKLGAAIAGAAGIMFIYLSAFPSSLWVLWPTVFCYVLAFGIMMPITNAVALEKAGHVAGTASSILSSIPTIGAAFGAAISSSVDGPNGPGVFTDGYQSLTQMMALGGIATCVIVFAFGMGPKKSKAPDDTSEEAA